MTNDECVRLLARRIDESILPLITSNYVFWGLPYYVNPGDTLIWEGTLELLKGCKYKCLGTCGWDEYKYVPLKEDTVILIIGGGFFGDLWRKAWSQVMDTITKYPNNPIVILPQSIHYDDADIAADDAARLAPLKNLTICLRDEKSYEYSKKHFTNVTSLLVPDLAFHMNLKKLRKWSQPETERSLYLKRNDKELGTQAESVVDESFDVSDWPAMCGKWSFSMRLVNRLYYLFKPRSRKLATAIMHYGNRNVVIRDAVRFISQYHTIYTTRLHVMVLAYLLGKNVYILDNSYGKIGGVQRLWLKDAENIKIYEE